MYDRFKYLQPQSSINALAHVQYTRLHKAVGLHLTSTSIKQWKVKTVQAKAFNPSGSRIWCFSFVQLVKHGRHWSLFVNLETNVHSRHECHSTRSPHQQWALRIEWILYYHNEGATIHNKVMTGIVSRQRLTVRTAGITADYNYILNVRLCTLVQ